MTKITEKQWISLFKAAIKAMPKSLEIVAYNRSISICEAGPLRSFLDTNKGYGTADYVDTVQHPRIHTHSESK